MSINIKNKFNIKRWALCGVVAFAAHTASYAQTSSSNNGPKKAQTEQKANSQPQTLEDSTAVETLPSPAKQENQKNKVDSEKNSTKAQDEIKALREKRLSEAMELATYYICQFEGFSPKAEQVSATKSKKGNNQGKEKHWTIGFGNTIKPDGTPVQEGDVITSVEEAMFYFQEHVYKIKKSDGLSMAEAMVKYLPLEKMTDQEIAVMAGFCWNCGHKYLNPNAERYLRSAEYFNNRTKANQKIFFDRLSTFNKAKVKKGNKYVWVVVEGLVSRRETDKKVLAGLLYITLDDSTVPPEMKGKAVNLRTSVIGLLNDCKGSAEKAVKLSQTPYYKVNIKEYGDSITQKVTVELRRLNRESEGTKIAMNNSGKQL